MNFAPLRKRLPFAIALMFFLLAFGRPAQRGVWIILGFALLVMGLRRSNAAAP
jgi:hypothetical protein